jgi:ABC-type antimicrobial peptide transport system permease subunit
VALGNALAHQSAGTFVGGELEIASQRWPVVGRFVALGSAYESELWVDRDRLGDAFKRPGFSSAVARLTSPTAFDAFKASVEDDPRFKVKVMREDRYWEDQAASTATFIRVLGLFISSVFSIGAVLGAMITMYAQVAARTREVGMMRALGFSRRSVLAGFLVESALLGGAGGLLGAAAALAMGFVQIRTLNFQTFSQVRFGFTPTPGILLAALCFGAGMGFLGGMLPAVRAARLGVLEAVRS